MTTERILTHDFVHWATQAGYSVTPVTGDGRALVWSGAGETRLFIGLAENGWYAVQSSDRMAAEQLEWATPLASLVQSWFIVQFLSTIRRHRRLPRINLPGRREQLDPTFSLGQYDFMDRDYRSLIRGGVPVAISAGGELLSSTRLVQLSALLDHDLDQMIASYSHPDGEPLFAI